MTFRTAISVGLGLVLLTAAGCRKNDYRVLAFRVPEMKNEACADVVRQAVEGSERIKLPDSADGASARAARKRALGKMEIQIDLETRTVQLWYDSIITAEKNIEYRVAEAGFDVETKSRGEPIVIQADPVAKANLPDACR